MLENVGNLVCPAEFDTGAVKNAMILSASGSRKDHRVLHRAGIKFRRANEIAHILQHNEIQALRPDLPQALLGHPGIQVAHAAGMQLDGVPRPQLWCGHPHRCQCPPPSHRCAFPPAAAPPSAAGWWSCRCRGSTSGSAERSYPPSAPPAGGLPPGRCWQRCFLLSSIVLNSIISPLFPLC